MRFSFRKNVKGKKTAADSAVSNSRLVRNKQRKVLSMKTKREIIDKYERGGKLCAIAREYGRNPSTIGTILKQKEVIKAGKPSKGPTIMSKRRTPIHDKMERLLLVWIKDKGETVSKAASDEQPTASTSSQEAPLTSPEFRASHGWFYRFKKRTGNHSVVRHGEAASSDHKAAEEFVKKFEELINQEGYIPQQVFNCDETGLFWKKMPRRTYITAEEIKMPGHNGTVRSNPKAWVTRQFFVEWVNLVFGPAVKKFLEENELPMKCPLIIDNAHPSGLEDDILEEFSFIKVLFLPPNTTPLLQPMDQQVTSNLKRPYTKHMFKRCSDITESTQLSLREFWKNHFDIAACLKLISLAWREVSRRMLNSAWRKLWPDAVAPRDFEGFEGEPQPEVKVEEIVNLGTALGLQVDEEDINDLVHEHREELSTAELQELEAMLHSSVQQQFSEEEAVIPSADIKDNHPEKTFTAHAIEHFGDISHFRSILKSRQRQTSLDRFFTKRPATSQPSGESVPTCSICMHAYS
uniref:HTH CENPB-type domain-containing protein n=1 Tax=Astatotilapia calliptera TaxID=8154 RepID=A0A3P8PYC6_ASTCA